MTAPPLGSPPATHMTMPFSTRPSARPGAPAVVLLHPLGGDSRFWEPVVALLPDVTIVLVDLPGHGQGATPARPYTIGDVAHSLAMSLRRGNFGPVHLVGVSLGGLVAQAFAARFPRLVDHLVLVDTVAVYPLRLQTMWRERAAAARSGGLEQFVEPTVQAWFAEPSSPPAHRVRDTLRAMDPEGYAVACEALAEADTRADCACIEAPTMVVCGVDDSPAFVDAATWLSRATGDGPLVWLTGRHAVVAERPTDFVDELVRFWPAP